MFQDHLALTPDGKTLLVSNFSGNDVIGIDLASMKEASRLRLPEKVAASRSAPHVVTYGPLRKHAYVTHLTGFAVIDPAEGKLVRLHQNNASPCGLAFSADEAKVYFSTFCYNRVPGAGPVRLLVSNSGEGTVQLIEVSKEGKLKSLGKAEVGRTPRQFAFLPAAGR